MIWAFRSGRPGPAARLESRAASLAPSRAADRLLPHLLARVLLSEQIPQRAMTILAQSSVSQTLDPITQERAEALGFGSP